MPGIRLSMKILYIFTKQTKNLMLTDNRTVNKNTVPSTETFYTINNKDLTMNDIQTDLTYMHLTAST